mmetsp:Transcript_15149/g.39366  ORF Transcript_15149/g.39366 Transcript_15149/m.39366 type:complete len:201 (+) Transcript_15149:120-722(+)
MRWSLCSSVVLMTMASHREQRQPDRLGELSVFGSICTIVSECGIPGRRAHRGSRSAAVVLSVRLLLDRDIFLLSRLPIAVVSAVHGGRCTPAHRSCSTCGGLLLLRLDLLLHACMPLGTAPAAGCARACSRPTVVPLIDSIVGGPVIALSWLRRSRTRSLWCQSATRACAGGCAARADLCRGGSVRDCHASGRRVTSRGG